MVMTHRDYNAMMADPKRREAGRKAADTRIRRQARHAQMRGEAIRSGFRGLKVDYINQVSPKYDDLLGTKWARGSI